MVDRICRVERSDDLATMTDIEQRITLMVRTVESVTHKVHDCLRIKELPTSGHGENDTGEHTIVSKKKVGVGGPGDAHVSTCRAN
jgi:hypothetical protein